MPRMPRVRSSISADARNRVLKGLGARECSAHRQGTGCCDGTVCNANHTCTEPGADGLSPSNPANPHQALSVDPARARRSPFVLPGKTGERLRCGQRSVEWTQESMRMRCDLSAVSRSLERAEAPRVQALGKSIGIRNFLPPTDAPRISAPLGSAELRVVSSKPGRQVRSGLKPEFPASREAMLLHCTCAHRQECRNLFRWDLRPHQRAHLQLR